MGNPSKPSHVNVPELKTVLAKLQQMQSHIQEGRPGSWDSIGNGDAIAQDLKGMQENVATQTGQYYGDLTYHITNSWNDIKGGIDTLVQLVQGTVDAHTKNDQDVAHGANSVNTGQSASADAKG